MGPPSYMQSVVDRNVLMRSIPVFRHDYLSSLTNTLKKETDSSTETVTTRYHIHQTVILKHVAPSN